MMTDGDLDVIVRQIRLETSEVRSFVLESASGEPLPKFEAGAHVDVFPIPGLSRQYSLVNDPADCSHYVLGVKREPNSRGGSSALHGNLQEGSKLRISRPKNNFPLRHHKGRNILLAGGIGVTPLLSMSQALFRREAEFQLHYFVRSNSEMAFRELIIGGDWSNRVNYHFGLVPPLLNDVLEEILRAPDADDLVYLCGPGPFMDVVRGCAANAGWANGQIVLEHFSARRGIDLIVPSDKSIVEVLRGSGIEVQTSCEQGVCGTCVTQVLEGELLHNDLYLSDDEHEEGRLMTPCVSRCKSKLLVLDI